METAGLALRRIAGEPSISEEQDAREFLAVTQDLDKIDWVVVDHYGLGESWQSLVRSRATRILVIDDLADRRHDCDLLLDQNLLANDDRPYDGLIPPSAMLLAGPRFALLRPAFSRLRSALSRARGPVRTVLICFGGTDPRNHTSAAIEAISSLAESPAATQVVIGRGNRNADVIAALCRRLPNCNLLVAPPHLPELLVQSDLAVGAGGTMMWERACLGVPTIAVGVAANQVRVVERAVEMGLAVGVPEMFEPDVATLRDLLALALKSPAMLKGMSRRAQALVDGKGVHRVADELLAVPLTFRRATLADCEAILNWRNHATVRAISLESNEIRPDDHRRWLEQTLSDPNRVLLICESRGQSVGVVRFDLEPDSAMISVYRVPESEHRRIGLIRNAVEWLRRNRKEICRVVAQVKTDNAPSYEAFRSAGFIENARTLLMELK